jgi:hypothetical protein
MLPEADFRAFSRERRSSRTIWFCVPSVIGHRLIDDFLTIA